MSERSYLSIGEVLALLQEEFPDITISKIRFLESQGLIDPERTPSGYRKFYDTDIERLRFILREQREHFLPLKVIKDRLEHGAEVAPAEAAARAPADGSLTPSDPVAAGTGMSLTFDELATAAGLRPEELRDVEKFGLVEPRVMGRTPYYDEEALVAARLAAGFLRHGIEPRHLRMYRTAAEREAGLFEQVILPLVKQRNPQSRAEAHERLGALSELGGQLRDAMLRRALREYIGPSR